MNAKLRVERIPATQVAIGDDIWTRGDFRKVYAMQLHEDSGCIDASCRGAYLLTLEPGCYALRLLSDERPGGVTLTAEECATLKGWNEFSVGYVYRDEPDLRSGFCSTPVAAVMARVAAGAEGARS